MTADGQPTGSLKILTICPRRPLGLRLTNWQHDPLAPGANGSPELGTQSDRRLAGPPGCRKPSGPVPGWTMLELVTVVAIVGILLTLLLPAVSRLRGAARRIQCQSHLRNLGLATQQYVDGPPTVSAGRFAASGRASCGAVRFRPDTVSSPICCRFRTRDPSISNSISSVTGMTRSMPRGLASIWAASWFVRPHPTSDIVSTSVTTIRPFVWIRVSEPAWASC